MSTETTDERAKLAADCLAFHRGDEGLAVLLIRREWPPFQGCWAIPGGHVDRGERCEAAAARELAEETGVEVTVDQLITVGGYHAPDRDPRCRVVSFAYAAVLTGERPVPVAADDAAAAEWVAVDQLDQLDLAFDHATILRDALALLAVPRDRS